MAVYDGGIESDDVGADGGQACEDGIGDGCVNDGVRLEPLWSMSKITVQLLVTRGTDGSVVPGFLNLTGAEVEP